MVHGDGVACANLADDLRPHMQRREGVLPFFQDEFTN
jgi:hypothetical protein